MTVTDQIKILNRKIKQNESQYDLDREAAKISALSSNNLDKYEYLTGEDLGLKPSTVEKAKFEYSPLGKIFNKGLSKEDKKEGLFKKLKNIEDKNEQLLKIKNKAENIKEVTGFVEESFSLEAKALIEEIRTIQKNVDYRKLIIRGGNNVTYDFSNYKTCNELYRDLYYKKMTINDTEIRQNEFNSIRHTLNNYTPKDEKYIEARNSLINNAKNFYEGRETIIEDFKEGIFLLKSADNEFGKRQTSKNTTKPDVDEFNERINKKETGINRELFKNYFSFQTPSALLKDLYKTNDKEKNNKLVSVINSGIKELKKEIKKMSEEEIENKKPHKIVEIVEKILHFNKKIQKQSGQGIKILTPSQMFSRLPITLAQLEAGNNSEKLKNEIRQLLYSLYCSKI